MIRPSNLERRKSCPGSEKLEEGLPNEESLESREGTLLHYYLAHPEFVRDALSPKLQELLKINDELDQQVFTTVVTNEKMFDTDDYEDVVEEREVEGQWYNLIGHMDLRRRYPKRGITVIRDAKFGFIPVEPAEVNMQMRGYAGMNEDEIIYVAITQPRAPFNQRVTLARYTRQDISDARKQITEILNACQEPDAPLHAGDWCRYCRARSICPELAKAVQGGLVPFEAIPEGLSKAARLGRVEARLAQVSDDQLGKMLEAYTLIQFVHEPMLDEARRRIEAGQLEDWKLGKVIERRKITDSAKAISLLALAGMHRDEIMACANLSLTKLEEKLNGGELRFGMVKSAKDARDFTNQVLESVLEIETAKPRVLKK